MQEAIKMISDKYPPGKGLSQEQKDLEEVLRNLNMKDNFSHQPSKFTQK